MVRYIRVGIYATETVLYLYWERNLFLLTQKHKATRVIFIVDEANVYKRIDVFFLSFDIVSESKLTLFYTILF